MFVNRSNNKYTSIHFYSIKIREWPQALNMNIEWIYFRYILFLCLECWCSLNHSSIQPTNQLKIALAFNGILLLDYIIGAAREEFLNLPWGAEYTSYHICHVSYLFFLFLIVLLSRVTANTLTELSWLDMDVWWDIGNCDMLTRRACIP